MPQIINTNIASLNAQRNLDKSQAEQSTALQRLSSGLRINGAKDDAAGLAISNRLDAQVRGLNVANRNAGDGVSLAQTAEGALNSITGSLQRMRELALQAANGSNTALERASLQEEVDQLKTEIATIAEKTNFNGQNLLDGSFKDKSFQTGANVGEKIDVSISRTAQDTLGTSIGNGISSSTTSGTVALAAGDITINGFSVGAANAADDGASTGQASESSIAVAAAINKVSDNTGVTATVNANTIGGVNPTSSLVAAAAVAVTINGLAITVSGTGVAANLGADLQGVADTINANTGQTGVTASIDLNNLGGGVSLSAEDGRNIIISGTGVAHGIAAAATYKGTYTLTSNDGSDITVGSTTGLSKEAAGLEIGTYSGSNSGLNGDAVSAAALVTGDITINGVSVGASLAADDNASTATKSFSAIAKAAAINRVSDQTGVTASAANTQVTSGTVNATAVASLTLNGVAITDVAAAGTAGEKMDNLITNINNKTAQTGITATVIDGTSYELIAADGRNIVVGGTITNTGLTAATTRGSITLESAGEITIGSAVDGAAAQTALRAGFRVGTYGGGSTGTLVQDIDVSTAAGATAAIAGIDNAINQVAREQGKLGALQNRFESTISNNAVNSENLSAANSRISDADFATETAALSRSQVLQQAGISVLAQANARPQQVLSLLQ